MKAYTDLSQSRKLAEILPTESDDIKTKDDFESALLGYTTAVLMDGDFEEDTFNFWCERLKEIAHKQFEIEAKVNSICLAQDYKVLD